MDMMMLQGIWLGFPSTGVVTPPATPSVQLIFWHPHHPSIPSHPNFVREL